MAFFILLLALSSTTIPLGWAYPGLSFASSPDATIQTCLSGLNVSVQINEDLEDLITVITNRNSYITREGGQVLLNGEQYTASGANVYWLGLDENVHPPAGQPFYAPLNASYPTKGRITEAFNILNAIGARTVRSQTLGVSVGNPLSVMPTLGNINNQAFDTIDWAIYQARQHGVRVIMPLIDNYDYFHGGKFTFLRWRGININTTAGYSTLPASVLQFYTNETIISDFKNYISHLLTHVNQYTGLSYAMDPTIAIIETGNELSGPIFGDKDVPNSWTREIAQFVKSIAPHALVMDGTYGINTTHFEVAEIDVYSDHFYPLNLTKLTEGVAAVRGTNRTYLAGEIDWTGNPKLDPPDTISLADFDNATLAYGNESNPTYIGDLFWSLFGHNVPNCNQFVNHSDGETLSYGNPLNTVKNDTQIAKLIRHLWATRNVTMDVTASTLPVVACPGPEVEYTNY